MTSESQAGADAVAGIAQTIFLLRGRRVILDSSLAAIYGVETRTLNQAVKRNSGRFPDDFRFQLIDSEVLSSRSQIVILNRTRGTNVKFLPYAFTEHGAIMAATVLNSPRAVEMSIYVVRAFVQLHTILASNAELALRLERLESGIEKRLTSHDEAIAAMFSAIRFQGRAKAALEVHGARLGTKRREPGLPP
ncbi:MAG TPA: ORF6N domain-containing protein [Steroidobacteraceae bacterium]|nr:ORF6N domain-containing protein [Steroidobacteraceae bacterium]